MKAASKAKSKSESEDVASVMEELKAKGKPSAATTYRRHGVTGETFGVSHADLGAMVKRLKTDHELALGLWATGVHDAQVLSTKIANPEQMTRRDIEQWLKSAGNYVITDALVDLAARMPAAEAQACAWIDMPGEWISAAGWGVVAKLALEARLEVSLAKTLIERIGKDIHRAPNRTRHTMNNALIAMGSAIDPVRDLVLQTAQAIGKVEVDHGETGCKTPDAASYIQKVVARNTARPSAAKAKAASRTTRKS